LPDQRRGPCAGLVGCFLRSHGLNELSGIQSTFATQTEFLLSNPIARDLEKPVPLDKIIDDLLALVAERNPVFCEFDGGRVIRLP